MIYRRPVSWTLIAGLAASVYNCAPATTATPSPQSTPTTQREVFLAGAAVKCPYNDAVGVVLPDASQGEIAPLLAVALAALIPIIIEKGIDLGGAALKKASRKDATSYERSTAVGVDHVYRLTASSQLVAAESFGCVFVGSGTPGEVKPKDKDWWVRAGFSAEPSFYAEANIEYSKDYSAFRLVPLRLSVTRFGSPGQSQRDIALTFGFKIPGASESFGSVTIPVRGVVQGRALGVTDFSGQKSEWMPLRPLTDTEKDRLKQLGVLEMASTRSAAEDEDLKELRQRLDGFAPANLAVSAVETQDYNKLLAAAGEILSENKKELATAIAGHILPSEKQQIESDTADLNAMKALAAAIAAVQEKAAELAALEAAKADKAAIKKAQNELVQLKYAANVAAVGAGVAMPYRIVPPKP